MPNQQLPDRIKSWLNDRGISDSVLEEFEIGWDGTHIVLPVHDRQGKTLFNKYRRDPAVEEGPKYRYDKGSASSLYGLKAIEARPHLSHVYIVEGELDALALISKGILAVSSTGGAGTWKPEWFEELPESISVCYDNDPAGFKGAFNIYAMNPSVRMVWLPKEIGEHGDVTDYFMKLGKTAEDFLKMRAWSYWMPEDWRGKGYDKQKMRELEAQYRKSIESLMDLARQERSAFRSDVHIQHAISIVMNRLEDIRKEQRRGARTNRDDGERLQRAKAVPISNFVEFNRQKYAKCIWHRDGTPSMCWYEKQNRVKCFGCSAMGDSIDVVRQLNQCGVREAIDFIIGNPA